MPNKKPKQLFRKLFYRYTVIVICIVLALAVYFISAIKARTLETNLNYRDMMAEEATGYVEECMGTANSIQANLYQSPDILNDLLMYFKSTDEEYQEYRLDTFMDSTSFSYEGFDDYVETAMKSYPQINSIEMISYDKSEVITCFPQSKVYIHQNAKERLADVETGNLAKDGEFSFGKEIRDPETLLGVGCMIVNFSGERLSQIQTYYSAAELLMTNQNDTVIYQSDKKLDTEEFLAFEKNEIVRDTQKAYVHRTDTAAYSVYTLADKKKSAQMPVSTVLTIWGVGLALILLGEWCVRTYLLHLTKRLNGIVEAMNMVKTGDLTVRLESDTNGDELDVISAQFNTMCEDLERHIQKSYLAEIQQKNAEMEVLQNQINPHFLYNTLEAIRMKAICNGDREVGKMLYSMSVIFRSQLKDSDIITLIQEVHYCKKYLELFEYRYQGKFTSTVECPEELMDYQVMKFILQPIVENYFVHGIRGEQEGNWVHIWVEKQEESLLIHVEDNGKGMTKEQLDEKNKELEQSAQVDKKSVGISNVNSRVKAVYGQGYGVELKAPKDGGMHVIIRIGIT